MNAARAVFRALAAVVLLAGFTPLQAEEKPPVRVGADLELSAKTSQSDDATLLGLQTAIAEINQAGGVLGGRKLELVTLDNGAMPARGRENLTKMLAMKDLVAVFGCKYSPITLEQMEIANRERLPLLAPWSAADALVDNDARPNYVFRLSLRDSWALKKMVEHARARGFTRLGFLAPENAWGRSSLKAVEAQMAPYPELTLVSVQWHYWGGEKTLLKHYDAIRQAGAQALLLVANEGEGALLFREMAEQPRDARLPVISHWGILAGRLTELAGPGLADIDLHVVHTRYFHPPRNARAARLGELGMARFGVDRPEKIPAGVGLANSYDLMHLLARAIDQAGSTDRIAIHHALENLPPYEGVIKRYARPFSPTRHEALSEADVIISRMGPQGELIPLPR